MDERFIPLAAFVRGPDLHLAAAAQSRAATEAIPVAGAPVEISSLTAKFPHADAVHELTLMRLAAHEAFERTKGALLAALGEHVLGRELALAPVELEALVARVVDDSRELEPVSLVLSATDAEQVRTPLRKRMDPSLAPGDFIVEVRDGALESPLRFRFGAALARASLGIA